MTMYVCAGSCVLPGSSLRTNFETTVAAWGFGEAEDMALTKMKHQRFCSGVQVKSIHVIEPVGAATAVCTEITTP